MLFIDLMSSSDALSYLINCDTRVEEVWLMLYGE